MSIVVMALSQVKRQIRSTKVAVLAVLLVFIRSLVSGPIEQAAERVAQASNGSADTGISFFQCFVSLGNSGMIALLIPLVFLVLISGIPCSEGFDMFVHIRTDRKNWLMAQILSILMISLGFVLFNLVASGLLTGKYMTFDMDYAYSATHFTRYFPQESGAYITTLIPANLYNQLKFADALLNTAILLWMEFILIGLVLLFFSVLNIKFVGVITEAVVIIVSAIMTAAGVAFQWVLPLPHTIVWLHKTEIYRQDIFPVWGSYLYFGGLIVLFLILNAVFLGKYECVRESGIRS